MKSAKTPEAFTSVEIDLTPTSYLVLGMVRLGATSGYAIKQAANLTTQTCWSTSMAQVYPELARLEAAKYLKRRSDPQGARARSTYSITKRGEAALRAWLLSSHSAPLQMRDEGILRLFFADALPREDQIELIQLMRENERSKSLQVRTAFLSAVGSEFLGTSYPAVVARFGADAFAFSERWLARLQAKLEADKRLGENYRRPSRRDRVGRDREGLARWILSTPYVSPILVSGDKEIDALPEDVRPTPTRPTELTLAARQSAPIKLTPTSFLVLGMVRLGFTSGYSIKMAAELSTQTFWPTSFGQLYPELARLEAAEHLKRRSDPQGARARSTYSITKRGEAALRAWLLSSHMAPLQIRNEWWLRLFFADTQTVKNQFVLIRRIREQYRTKCAWIRDEILPYVEAAETSQSRFPTSVARLGVDTWSYKVGRLTRLDAKLKRSQLSR